MYYNSINILAKKISYQKPKLINHYYIKSVIYGFVNVLVLLAIVAVVDFLFNEYDDKKDENFAVHQSELIMLDYVYPNF